MSKLKLTKEQEKVIQDIYKEMCVHSQLDWEWNAGGNGYNVHEAFGGIEAVMDEFKISKPTYPVKEDFIRVIENYGNTVEETLEYLGYEEGEYPWQN